MASRLVVVCGNAGTGKTTWAKRLARRHQAALLDLDTVSEKMVTAAQLELGRDPGDRDSPDYKRLYRDAIHETLFAIARDCEGYVIIVAPFTKERGSPGFRRWLAAQAGCEPEVHFFVCSPDVREARLRARNHPRDRNKLENYQAYRELGRAESPPAYEHRWFDTTSAFPELPESVGPAHGPAADGDAR